LPHWSKWLATPKGKIPYHIRLKSGEVFGMAGLYDNWTDTEGRELRTCVIITTEANELMAPSTTACRSSSARRMRRSGWTPR
jgi:putative SOS response-associated peptidase YedK